MTLFISTSYSRELITNSHMKVDLQTFSLPDGSKFSSYVGLGSWTDNYGNYGTSNCKGIIKTDDLNNIDLDIMCENNDKEDFKSRSISKRVSENFEQGIGESQYLNGTGVWKRLKGLKCRYATNYKNNISFTVEKCKISEEQHKFLIKKQ